jgi:CxxC-x17-CxxC domain-containing protein
MKKHTKSKFVSVEPEIGPDIGPDIAGLINKIVEQLASLERKIDSLMTRPSSPSYAQPQRQDHAHHRPSEMNQNNNFRDRVLHKAVCADCKKECQVPFKPTGDRPVYCKECFGKRKARSPFNEREGARPHSAPPERARFYDKFAKPRSGEKGRHADKRKPASRKKKR